MTDNLLVNGNFEEDWFQGPENQGHRAVKIDFIDGTSQLVYLGNIFNPPDWTCFFYHGGSLAHDPDNEEGYAQPECRSAEHTDPDRFRSGGRGQLLFTFSRVHDAGFFQRVEVGPGQRVRFSAWAHAWSNAWHGDHTDDPKWSEGAGHEAVSIPYGETEDHDLANFTFWIGIDPTGGRHPDGLNVRWSEGKHIYNAFDKLGPIEATAGETGIVTVFLRSCCMWRFKHNDAYWDDAALEAVGEEPDDEPQGQSRIGVHGLQSGRILQFSDRLVKAGLHFPVVKAVSDWGWIKELAIASPDTVTIGRVANRDLEGVGEVLDPNADLYEVAMGLVDLVSAEISKDPALMDAIDYWEICNEPLGGGVDSAAYVRLALVMKHAMDIAESRGLKLGLFAFNLGTPEWADMVAMVNTGVFNRAKQGGHILTLHEGVLGNIPIDTAYGDLIPGAPWVPNAGAFCFRYRYLYDILKTRDEVIPLVVSEWYPGGDPTLHKQTVSRYVWYDVMARYDDYMLGFAPFTCGAAYGWEGADQEPFYDAVVDYIIASSGGEPGNGDGPEPEPGRGAPRVPYRRTYVLLPPGVAEQWPYAAIHAVYEGGAGPLTIGPSADDAGIGDLDERRVIALLPDAWGPGEDGQGLYGFFETHYPGVDARQVVADEPKELYQILSTTAFADLPILKPYPAGAGTDPGNGPDPVTRGYFGLNLQTENVPTWQLFVDKARPPVMVVFQAEAARIIKELSPTTLVMWRYWVSDEEQEQLLGYEPSFAAGLFLQKFAPSLEVNAQWIDFAHSLNERYNWDDDRVARAARFDAEFCRQLNLLGLGVRPGVLAGPVGYPTRGQVNLIRPAVEACCEYDGVILYHGYYMMHNGQSLLEGAWHEHAGLFLESLDPIFQGWGLAPKYFQGEAGACGSRDGVSWEPGAGWRNPLCYNGDIDAYIADLAKLQANWHAWNVENNNRFLGAVLFTSGLQIGWPDFLIGPDEMEAIHTYLYP